MPNLTPQEEQELAAFRALWRTHLSESGKDRYLELLEKEARALKQNV